MFYLPLLGYQPTLLCDGFDKAVLSDQGPLPLQCSATSNLSVLTKNVLPSRYIPLIYFLNITLATSVFARFIPTSNVITNKFHIHFSTPTLQLFIGSYFQTAVSTMYPSLTSSCALLHYFSVSLSSSSCGPSLS